MFYFENNIENRAEKFLYIEQKRGHINLRITQSFIIKSTTAQQKCCFI